MFWDNLIIVRIRYLFWGRFGNIWELFATFGTYLLYLGLLLHLEEFFCIWDILVVSAIPRSEDIKQVGDFSNFVMLSGCGNCETPETSHKK